MVTPEALEILAIYYNHKIPEINHFKILWQDTAILSCEWRETGSLDLHRVKALKPTNTTPAWRISHQ